MIYEKHLLLPPTVDWLFSKYPLPLLFSSCRAKEQI
jgi:hypothetical protein